MGDSGATLITGASGGLGAALSRRAAADGHELVLVARTKTSLNALANECQCKTTVIAADLASPDAAESVFSTVQSEGIKVSRLINNAGVGVFGDFAENDFGQERDLVRVNIGALTELTHLFLPSMLQAQFGRILNVASLASFYPGPQLATYYASKAYVRSFTEALAFELQGTGVTATALCPGPFKSGFQQAADMVGTRLVSGNVPTVDEVAAYGWKVMERGRTVAVHKLGNKFLAQLARFVPRRVLGKAAARAQRIDE